MARGGGARKWDEDCNGQKRSSQHRKDGWGDVQRIFQTSRKAKVLALATSGPVTWGACRASSDWPCPLARIIGSVVIDTHHHTDSLNPKVGTKGPVVIFRVFSSWSLSGRRWNAIGKMGKKMEVGRKGRNTMSSTHALQINCHIKLLPELSASGKPPLTQYSEGCFFPLWNRWNSLSKILDQK